jgi:hypothetical protein
MGTPAGFYRSLFEKMNHRPQDAQQLVDSVMSMTDGINTVLNIAVSVAVAGTKVLDDLNRRHTKNLNDILKFVLVRSYYDSLAIIRLHPLRWGINDEVAKRAVTALNNGNKIVNSLNQLLEQGGVSEEMELQLVTTQQLGYLKAVVNAEKARNDAPWPFLEKQSLDQIINYLENQVTAAILKKLSDIAFNGVLDYNIATNALQLNRQQRVPNVKTLYQASDNSLDIVYTYYKNLRQTIHNAPSDKPFQQALVWSPFGGLGADADGGGMFGGGSAGGVFGGIGPIVAATVGGAK